MVPLDVTATCAEAHLTVPQPWLGWEFAQLLEISLAGGRAPTPPGEAEFRATGETEKKKEEAKPETFVWGSPVPIVAALPETPTASALNPSDFELGAPSACSAPAAELHSACLAEEPETAPRPSSLEPCTPQAAPPLGSELGAPSACSTPAAELHSACLVEEPETAPRLSSQEPCTPQAAPPLQPELGAPSACSASAAELHSACLVEDPEPAPQPSSLEPCTPQAVPPLEPWALPPELAALVERVGAIVTVRTPATATEGPRPRPPATALAFAARLSDRGPEQVRGELLALLSSPEPASPSLAKAPPEGVLEGQPPMEPSEPASDREAAPAAQPRPVESERPAAELREPFRQGEAVSGESNPRERTDAAERRPAAPPKPRPQPELATRPHPVPRASSVSAHTVAGEVRTPSMAPYRTPEFIATQPGTRTPWSNLAELPALPIEHPQGPVQELSVVVSARAGEDRDPPQVQVRIVERGGEVKVAVHTPDVELSQALRERLGELVQRLEQTGYRTETWSPAETRLEGISRRESQAEQESADGRHSQNYSQGSAQHNARRQKHRPEDQPLWFESLTAAGFGGRAAPTWSEKRI